MGRHHPLSGMAPSLEDYLAWPHLQVSGGGQDSPVEQVLAPAGSPAAGLPGALLPGSGGGAAAHRLSDDHPGPYRLAALPGTCPEFCDLPFATRVQQYHLLWHQRHHLDPAHRWFRELAYPFLRDHLQFTLGRVASSWPEGRR